MMGPGLMPIYLAVALAGVSDSTPANTWIADLKANKALVAGRAVRIEGQVVDLRATSPMASRGLYRLIDATDPAGVLIRTERLPIDGGAFRVRGRVASTLSADSLPLLDEIERQRQGGSPFFPLALAGASGLALVALAILFARATTEEHRNRISAPLWLLPNLGPYGKTTAGTEGAAPALNYEPDLEDADRLQRERLRRRKHSLFQALIASVAVAASSTAWAINTRHPSGPVPAFIFVDAEDRPVAEPTPPALADQPPTVVIDSASKAPASSASSAFVTVRPEKPPTTPPPRRRDSAPQRVAVTAPVRRPDSVLRADSARATTAGTTAEVTPPSRVPVPTPSPPPPPVVEPRDETPDPAVDRARAAEALSGLAGRLVAAIASKNMSELSSLMPADVAVDVGRRERFLKFVREFGPHAGLGGIEETTVAGDRGEARFAVSFTWRGDFGVDSRKPGRFLGILRRQNGEWRPAGVRFLDGVP
jgi:hypothetical protein